MRDKHNSPPVGHPVCRAHPVPVVMRRCRVWVDCSTPERMVRRDYECPDCGAKVLGEAI